MRNVEERKEVNVDFNIDESCSADKNIQCNLYKNEIEKLQKELIVYEPELIERSEEVYDQLNCVVSHGTIRRYLSQSSKRILKIVCAP